MEPKCDPPDLVARRVADETTPRRLQAILAESALVLEPQVMKRAKVTRRVSEGHHAARRCSVVLAPAAAQWFVRNPSPHARAFNARKEGSSAALDEVLWDACQLGGEQFRPLQLVVPAVIVGFVAGVVLEWGRTQCHTATAMML